jgi:predicted negative regulator of RcsB-dependent stress response
VSNERLGDVYLAQGNLAAALQQYRASLDRWVSLRDREPSNTDLQRFTSVALNKVGDVLVLQGDLPGALRSFRDGLAIVEQLAKGAPDNAGWQRDLSVSHLMIGDVLKAQGNPGEALTSFRAGLAIRERLAQADPANAQWQWDLLPAHWRLAATGDEPARRWPLVIAAIRKLKDENKLSPDRARFLPIAEERLAQLEAQVSPK